MCECCISATMYGQIWHLCEVDTSMMMDEGIYGPEAIVNKLNEYRETIAALEARVVVQCVCCSGSGRVNGLTYDENGREVTIEDDCFACKGIGWTIGFAEAPANVDMKDHEIPF